MCAGETLAGHEQLRRFVGAEQSAQQIGHAAIGDEPDVDEGEHHLRRLLHDGEVAGQGDAHAHASHGALHPSDGGLGQGLEPHDKLTAVADTTLGHVDSAIQPFFHGLHVAAGAEVAAGAADDHGSDVIMLLAVGQALGQVLHGLCGDGVVLLRLVEQDIGHVLFDLKCDVIGFKIQFHHCFSPYFVPTVIFR